MKLRILTFITLLAACLPARAVENLTTLLPEDSAFFMSMLDSHLFEKLDDHPIAKIISQSELRKVFAPLMKEQITGRERAEKIYKEEAGMTPTELQKFFPGGTVGGMKFDFIRMLDDLTKNRANPVAPSPFEYIDFVVATAFTGDEALTEKLARAYGRVMKEALDATSAAHDAPKPGADIGNGQRQGVTDGAAATTASALKLARFPDDYDASTDDYAGVKLHLWKIKQGIKSPIETPCYTLFDGALVISTSERGLRGAVDRVKKGGASLADSARHKQMLKTAKETDMFMCFDIATVVHPAMDKTAKEGGFAAGQSLSLMRALGVHKLDFFYFTLDASKNRADMEFGLTFHDQPGIMKVLAIDGPGTVPNFIPPEADSAGHGTLHLDRVLAGIEALMKEGMPIMGDMIGTQIDDLKKRTGVDIRKDLIANIGPDMWTASAPLPESTTKKKEDEADDEMPESQIVAFKVRNRSAVELALDTLINKLAQDAAMFEKREYQGHSIHNMKGAPISYMFTDDWIILSVGAPNLLEKTLTRMAKGGDDHLFALPVVKAAFAGLPDGDDGSSFMDLGATLDRLLTLLGKENEIPPLKALINFDDPPKSLNLPLVIGVRQYHDDTSFRARVHVTEKAK